MKKILTSIAIFGALLLNANETNDLAKGAIDINIEEAVTANHKLIKILFEEKNKMNDEIKILKKEIEDLKKQKISFDSFKPTSNEIYVRKFVFSDGVNIRTSPNSSSEVIGILGSGEIVNCTSMIKGWCKNENNNYVWDGYLSRVQNLNLLETKDVFAKKGINRNSPTELIERGTKVKAIGIVKDKYFLENGLVIDKKDAVR